MITVEQIHKLSFEDKLRMMEVLWDDISRHPENVEVPQWHKDLLDQREQLVREGKAQFVDWEVAKKQIRDSSK